MAIDLATLFRSCQRWRDRRGSYRPAGEPIRPERFGVEPIDEGPARDFVVRHHYSGTYPAARARAGLYRCRPHAEPELVGVAVFSVPMNRRVVPCYAPGLDPSEGVELGRFVLLDDVRANGETWFLARAFRLLQEQLPNVRVVVSYSDPVQRRTLDGDVVLPGHVGTIYQAHNGRYVGRSSARYLRLAPDGTVLSGRLLSKVRNQERGADYAYRRLLAAGAPERAPRERWRSYVQRALADGPFRSVRHPGNHVYVWPIGQTRRDRLDVQRRFRPALSYPKQADSAP